MEYVFLPNEPMQTVMQREPYIVYVKPDEKNRIVAINSSAFLTDLTGWVEIGSGFGDKYHHAQGNYFDQSVYDKRGICRYKLVDGNPVERTHEEMDADVVIPVPKPSDAERIAALEAQLAAYEAAYAEGVNEA